MDRRLTENADTSEQAAYLQEFYHLVSRARSWKSDEQPKKKSRATKYEIECRSKNLQQGQEMAPLKTNMKSVNKGDLNSGISAPKNL